MSKAEENTTFKTIGFLSIVGGLVFLVTGIALLVAPQAFSGLFYSGDIPLSDKATGYLHLIGSVWTLLSALICLGSFWFFKEQEKGFRLYLIASGFFAAACLVVFQWGFLLIALLLMVIVGSQYPHFRKTA